MTDTTESLRTVFNNWSPSYGGIPAPEEIELMQAGLAALARLEAAERAVYERGYATGVLAENARIKAGLAALAREETPHD